MKNEYKTKGLVKGLRKQIIYHDSFLVFDIVLFSFMLLLTSESMWQSLIFAAVAVLVILQELTFILSVFTELEKINRKMVTK